MFGRNEYASPCGCYQRGTDIHWCDGHLVDPDWPPTHPAPGSARRLARRLTRVAVWSYLQAVFLGLMVGVGVVSNLPVPSMAVYPLVLLCGAAGIGVAGPWSRYNVSREMWLGQSPDAAYRSMLRWMPPQRGL